VAATWRGAITFSGFPVNIALHTAVKSRSSESFRTLAPDGLPIRTQMVDSSGEVVEREDTRKGVQTGKDQWTALTPEAVDAIDSGQKSTVVEADSYAPVDTLPRHLATAAYAVTADDKVAGAQKSVNVLWNGLRASRLAYMAQATLRNGGRDAILAIWATDDGLWAAALPFAGELHVAPDFGFTEDERAAALFQQVVERDADVVPTRPFEFPAWESEYRVRRQKAIDAVLAGEQVEAPTPVAESAAAPDLMAALAASLDSEPAAKPKARAKSGGRKKVTA
jgi:non-homologous end joining protein Ku